MPCSLFVSRSLSNRKMRIALFPLSLPLAELSLPQISGDRVRFLWRSLIPSLVPWLSADHQQPSAPAQPNPLESAATIRCNEGRVGGRGSTRTLRDEISGNPAYQSMQWHATDCRMA